MLHFKICMRIQKEYNGVNIVSFLYSLTAKYYESLILNIRIKELNGEIT